MSVSNLCERIDDARDLRLSLLEAFARIVPYDAFAWLLTDR